MGWLRKRRALKEVSKLSAEALVYRRAYDLLRRHEVNNTTAAIGLLEHIKSCKLRAAFLLEDIRS